MLKLRSLRAKMLVLILVPVIAALAATTLLAISHAGKAQKKSAYGELSQQTTAESLKVDAKVGQALETAKDAAALLS